MGLISEIMDINLDIILEEKESKYPKFISRFISKRKRNKLISICKKLKKANTPISKEDLEEFFIYVYNEYGNSTNIFDYIMSVNYYDAVNVVEGIITIDNLEAKISIDNIENSMEILLSIKEDENNSRYTINDSRVFSSNPAIKSDVMKINNAIISDMTTYILDNLNNYNKEK